MYVLLSRRLLWRERGVLLLLFTLVRCHLLPLGVLLFELRQESIPVLAGKVWVFGKFFTDHELFDAVDGMDVPHAVGHYSHYCLDVLVVAHAGHGVALHQNVAVREEFEGFEGLAIRSHESLSSLDKLLFVGHDATYFDYLCKHPVVLNDFDGLLERD